MASSEAVPYAKSGGLADVSGSLPTALADLGCRIHLFLPFYREIMKKNFPLQRSSKGLAPVIGKKERSIDVYSHDSSPGITVHFIREDSFFDRSGLYGEGGVDYRDNGQRFALFCQSVLLACDDMRIEPDLFHLHDWQAALLPVFLKHRPDLFPSLASRPTLLTIHNLAYQGLFPPATLESVELPRDLLSVEGLEFYGNVNFLKGGILSADAVSTVSRRYCREIQTTEYGNGLEGVLALRRGDLYGILNGVDYETWNPASDPHLAAVYSLADPSGKEACKEDLLDRMALPADLSRPLMATISRLIDQKGFDIILPLVPSLVKLGYRYILLGTGEARYEKAFSELAEEYPDDVAVKIAYDETLSHQIEAGADFFLMPSRFEPCGLNQIYSLRYGTVPIVRATGGLDDTVMNFETSAGSGNGIKFEEYSPAALLQGARRGIDIYSNPSWRSRIMSNAMRSDYSWRSSAFEYLDLYKKLGAQ